MRRTISQNLTVLIASLALAGGLSADITVSSDPVGYYRVPLTTGFQTIGVSLVHPPVLSTTVDSSDTDSVTSTDNGIDVGALLDPEKEYYLEVVDGPASKDDVNVGHRFEVDEALTINVATPDGIIVLDAAASANTVSAVPALDDYQVVVRPHVTLAEAFVKEPLFASFDLGLADQVQVYNGSSFSPYYLLGSNGPGDLKIWGTFDFQDADDTVILPGQGLLYKRSNLAPSGVDLVITGEARSNPFYQPLDPGFNFVAEPFPITASFTSRDAFPLPFEPSFDIGLADQVQVYNGSSFTTYFLAGDVTTNAWLLTDDFLTNQNDTEVFDFRRSVFVKKSNPTTAYRVPLSWTP